MTLTVLQSTHKQLPKHELVMNEWSKIQIIEQTGGSQKQTPYYNDEITCTWDLNSDVNNELKINAQSVKDPSRNLQR